MVHYRRMVAAALRKLEEEARESGAPIDLGTGEGGGGGVERGDDVDDHADDGSFHGSTAQQVGAMVLRHCCSKRTWINGCAGFWHWVCV